MTTNREDVWEQREKRLSGNTEGNCGKHVMRTYSPMNITGMTTENEIEWTL